MSVIVGHTRTLFVTTPKFKAFKDACKDCSVFRSDATFNDKNDLCENGVPRSEFQLFRFGISGHGRIRGFIGRQINECLTPEIYSYVFSIARDFNYVQNAAFFFFLYHAFPKKDIGGLILTEAGVFAQPSLNLVPKDDFQTAMRDLFLVNIAIEDAKSTIPLNGVLTGLVALGNGDLRLLASFSGRPFFKRIVQYLRKNTALNEVLHLIADRDFETENPLSLPV